jgi:hypothetical protein
LGGTSDMSIRSYKITIAVLALLVVALAWKCFAYYGQMVTAAFISHQCENVGDYAVEASNPGSLTHDLAFLVGYYDYYGKKLAGSPIHRVVYRDYQHAVTNVITQLRLITTNDLGGDPRAWIQKYGM